MMARTGKRPESRLQPCFRNHDHPVVGEAPGDQRPIAKQRV
jgi:hypothetical protein